MIFVILSDWFTHQPTPMQLAVGLGALLAVVVVAIVIKTLCGLVDVVFDAVETRASAQLVPAHLEE